MRHNKKAIFFNNHSELTSIKYASSFEPSSRLFFELHTKISLQREGVLEVKVLLYLGENRTFKFSFAMGPSLPYVSD